MTSNKKQTEKKTLYTRCSRCGAFAQQPVGEKCRECGDGVMV